MSVVQRRLDLMAAEGIQFVNGVNVGVDYGADKITDESDAIVLCGGATKPRDLPLDGRNLRGVAAGWPPRFARLYSCD